MKTAQRTLAHFLGGGLRLRSARNEYIELNQNSLIENQRGSFITFSFMLHELNREQVLFYGFNQSGGWDQGHIMYITPDNKLQVRAKSVYVRSSDMDGGGDAAYELQPGGYYEKPQVGGTMFIGTTTLEANKIYTLAMWEGGRSRDIPQKYKDYSYNFDPNAPADQKVEFDYFYEGHEVWLNGVYQGHCGSTIVSIASGHPLGFGNHPKYRNRFCDMTLFHLDVSFTKGGTLPADNRSVIDKFFMENNLHNNGRGATMGELHKWLGNERIVSFDFSSNNTYPLRSTISAHRFELQPRYSIQAKNDRLRQQQDFRSHDTVNLTSQRFPTTDSPILRDHIFEEGNFRIINLGLTGELDSFDGRNAFPADYNNALEIYGNQMSGTSVINGSNMDYVNMSLQSGPGDNYITWNGQTRVISQFYASSAKLVQLDFQAGTRIGILDIANNPGLHNFNLNNLVAGLPGTFVADNTPLSNIQWPQSESGYQGFNFSAQNNQIPHINLAAAIHGWRNMDLRGSTALTGITWPAPGQHQPMNTLLISSAPWQGVMDLTPVPGISSLTVINCPGVTSILIPPVNGYSDRYYIRNTGISSLNMSMVTNMGYDLDVSSNPNLVTFQPPSADRGFQSVTIALNPLLTGVMDLRWAIKGMDGLFIGGCPNVTQWIFPDTVDDPGATFIGNMIGTIQCATPQVFDFSRTKIYNQMLIDGSHCTEFRYSAASFGFGARSMGRFELSQCPYLTRFDFSMYPSAAWDTCQLRNNNQMSVLTFPSGRNIQFNIFSIRYSQVNMVLPFGDGITVKQGGVIDILGCLFSAANIEATIVNLYNSRNLHDNGGFNKKLMIMNSGVYDSLSGSLQAPSGFVLGGSDGSPTTAKEMLYVLANQRHPSSAFKYMWDFQTELGYVFEQS